MLSLLKLLKQKSVDKVTVKDICDECEINRNTFYYYFKDIYDVLNNIFMEEIEKNLREAGSNGSFYEEYSRAAAILVVSSMLFWMALLIRLLLRLFLTSISLFLQNCRVLIRRSLILVTLTLTLLSGMKKQKTWLVVSSRTSLSSLVTKQVRNWLLLVRSCNLNFTDLTYNKWFLSGTTFFYA